MTMDNDFNLRIPFLVLPSARVADSRVITAACADVDFVPTLRAWLDIEAPVPLPGSSLLPAIRGADNASVEVRPSYGKTFAFNSLTDCIVQDGLKQIRVFDPKTQGLVARQVFDLEADPNEVHPLGVDPTIADPIFEQMAGMQGLRFKAHFSKTDEAVIERLQALGYFQ